MLKVLIIEDEQPALEHLVNSCARLNIPVQIMGTTSSVRESIAWLQQNPSPDLIFMDVQLNDGLSFHIFLHCTITAPVIFVTAYDQYITEALSNNGIYYLLKPLDDEQLQQAIHKYQTFRSHFLQNYTQLLEFFTQQLSQPRSRIVVKKGNEYLALPLEDTAYFFTESKLVYVVNRENKKFMVNKTLTELEAGLDKRRFFRANRQCIINIDFIAKFRPTERSKIQIDLTLPSHEEITVSQENAAQFREWVGSM